MRRIVFFGVMLVVLAAFVPGRAVPVPILAHPDPCKAGSPCAKTLGKIDDPLGKLKPDIQFAPCSDDYCGNSGGSSNPCWASSGTMGPTTKPIFGDPNTEVRYKFFYVIWHCPDESWQMDVSAWLGEGNAGQQDQVVAHLFNDSGKDIAVFSWDWTCCHTNDERFLGRISTGLVSSRDYGWPHDFYAGFRGAWPPSSVEGATNTYYFEAPKWHTE